MKRKTGSTERHDEEINASNLPAALHRANRRLKPTLFVFRHRLIITIALCLLNPTLALLRQLD